MNERPSLDPEAEVENDMHITSIPLNVSLKKKKKNQRWMSKMKESWLSFGSVYKEYETTGGILHCKN